MSEIDPFDIAGTDTSIQDVVKQSRKRINALARRNVRANQLEQLAPDGGDVGVMKINDLQATMTGRLNSVVVPADNMVALGGYIVVSKDAGQIAADIAIGQTSVDFGKTMTPGDWVKIQARDANDNLPVEWMLVGSLVSGTTYNVTRDVDGSGDKSWWSGVPFAVVGQNGDNRIELVAGASATIRLITQGATWDAYTVQSEMSTVAGAITAGAGSVALDSDGIKLLASNTSPLSFVDTDGNQLVTILNAGSANPVTSEPDLIISALQKTGKDSNVTIEATAASGNTPYLVLKASESGASSAQIVLINTSITLNYAGEDVDTIIKGATNDNLLVVDAGFDAVGIGGAAESGYALAVTGDTKVGNLAVTTLNGKNIWKLAYKAADQSKTADTTLANDTDLIFNPVTSGKKYAIRGRIFFDTAATPDFKYRIGGSATITPLRIFTKHVVPGATALTNAIETAFPTTTQAVTGAGSTGGYIEIDGQFVVTGTGTIALQWAQNSSSASATKVLAGSYLELLEVG